MIARRKTNLHLPPRMYIYEGRRKTTFYTITHQNKRINLGHDFFEAKRQLLELEQNKQAAGTIGEFMEWYLQNVSAKKSPRTHKDEQASMQRLKAVFGKLFFSELKPHHIAKWHDMRGEDAPIRANREKSLLSQTLSRLTEQQNGAIHLSRGKQSFSKECRAKSSIERTHLFCTAKQIDSTAN